MCHADWPPTMPHLTPEEMKILIPELRRLDNFRALDLSGSEREAVMNVLNELALMKYLETLCLSNCGLLTVPRQVLNLKQLKHLDLSQNKLMRLPADLCAALSHMEMLDLSKNQLVYIPEDIDSLTHLTNLNLRSNQLTVLPPTINRLTALLELDIDWNRFKIIPPQLFEMPGLRCLNVENNPFSTPLEDRRLQKMKDCKSQRINIPVIANKLQRVINPPKDRLEAKAVLLLALIREAVLESPQLKLSIDDILRYEAERGLETVESRVPNRLTFYNFLLGRIWSERPSTSTGEVMDDYSVYAQQHWIPISYDSHANGKSFIAQHQEKVFKWQLFSSKIVFWTVNLIVLAGLVFSGVQFYLALRMPVQHQGVPDRKGRDHSLENPMYTEIEITYQSVKVKTAIVGVIILAISLAFFYLYLHFIYPIQPIGLSALQC
jgi:hypothetical protein